MPVFSSIDELIGNTPLFELKRIEEKLELKARIFAKLEYFNPAGSIKDRIAKSMLDAAEKKGILKEGGVIIEPTSGNTGIGLAALGAARGYRVIMTMPESMSKERRDSIKAYGAEVVLTPAADGMKGAIEKAKKLADEIPASFIPGQFDNPANPDAHYNTTGPEIWKDTDGRVSIFVAGAGTGGTLTGVGRYLKDKNPAIMIVAIEPAASPVISGGNPGPHKIQGIGAGFIPANLYVTLIDRVIKVENEEAFETCRLLAKTEGLLVGISSGAACFGAISLAKDPENRDREIVVIFPDTGTRYFSMPVFVETSD